MLVLDDEDGSSTLHQQQDSTAQPKQILSISTQRVCPASVSSQEVMRKNPLCLSPWLPACQECQTTGTICTHCVPDAEGLCDMCGCGWNQECTTAMGGPHDGPHEGPSEGVGHNGQMDHIWNIWTSICSCGPSCGPRGLPFPTAVLLVNLFQCYIKVDRYI